MSSAKFQIKTNVIINFTTAMDDGATNSRDYFGIPLLANRLNFALTFEEESCAQQKNIKVAIATSCFSGDQTQTSPRPNHDRDESCNLGCLFAKSLTMMYGKC